MNHSVYPDMFKEIAINAASEAGKILLDNLGKIKSAELKQKKDYVTNVDRLVEDKIKEIIKSRFPNHNIVTEESEVENRKSEYTWFIDPISSTTNFIHSLPHFAVSIALRKNNDFVLAVVFDPFYDELFCAEKGNGSFLNNSRIQVSDVEKISRSIICVGIYNRGDANIKEGIEYFKNVVEEGSFRRIGSTALEICYIACGRVEAHINKHSDIFAIPAGKLILEEAGGKLTDFENKNWNLESKSIIATNGKIHDELVKLIT